MQTGVNNLKTNKMSKGKYMYVKKNNAVALNRLRYRDVAENRVERYTKVGVWIF